MIESGATNTATLGMTLLAPSRMISGESQSEIQSTVSKNIQEQFRASGVETPFTWQWGDAGVTAGNFELYTTYMNQVSPGSGSAVTLAQAVTEADYLDRPNSTLLPQTDQVLNNLVTAFSTQLKTPAGLSPDQARFFYQKALVTLGRLASYEGSPSKELSPLGEKAKSARIALAQMPEVIELARTMPIKTDTRTDGVTRGGIDFDADLFALVVKKDGNGVPLPLSDQDADMLRFDGFVPVIKEIQQLNSLPILE